jgi:hypothetical protein
VLSTALAAADAREDRRRIASRTETIGTAFARAALALKPFAR